MRHTRIIVTHYGGPEELRVVEEECPEPKEGEVRDLAHPPTGGYTTNVGCESCH